MQSHQDRDGQIRAGPDDAETAERCGRPARLKAPTRNSQPRSFTVAVMRPRKQRRLELMAHKRIVMVIISQSSAKGSYRDRMPTRKQPNVGDNGNTTSLGNSMLGQPKRNSRPKECQAGTNETAQRRRSGPTDPRAAPVNSNRTLENDKSATERNPCYGSISNSQVIINSLSPDHRNGPPRYFNTISVKWSQGT